MSELPEGFPTYPVSVLRLFEELPFKPIAGYAHASLLYYHDRTYWCVWCRASEFVVTSRDPDTARQPVIRCEKCKRRWRVRDCMDDARRLSRPGP